MSAANRLVVQSRLDARKTSAERNVWGQFATPPELAGVIAREALGYLDGSPIRFLEPSLGTGAFFEALVGAAPACRIERALGIELDRGFVVAARELWAGTRLEVREGDFTLVAPGSERFNLVLANPPYVRHHHIEAGRKALLTAASERIVGRRVSGLAGLYVHFAILADAWLDEGAVCAWLVPSEFMDVNYGEALKRYLAERVELLRVHRYCPSDARFSDALVTSTVVFFRKAPARPGHRVRMTFGPDLESPERERSVPLAALAPERKWSAVADAASWEVEEEAPGVVHLGDLLAIKRGVATGDNGFFIVSTEEAREHGIPREFLRPILPSPRHVQMETVERGEGGHPALDGGRLLIDCALPEEEVARRYPAFFRYLMSGKEKGVDQGYLARSRAPWYSQEARMPPPLLCTYMGRAREGKPPFRIVLNLSDAIATNVWLLLYPKAWLRSFPDHARMLAAIIRRVDAGSFASEGRVYGGGLQKIEPRELARLPIEVPDEWAGLGDD